MSAYESVDGLDIELADGVLNAAPGAAPTSATP